MHYNIGHSPIDHTCPGECHSVLGDDRGSNYEGMCKWAKGPVGYALD